MPFALLFCVAILHLYATRPGPLRETQLVVIERGDSVDVITHKLEDARVVSRGWLFKLVYMFYKRTGLLQAGEYEFMAYISPEAVLHKLEDGDVYLRKLTVPEGITVREVAEIVQNIPQLFGEVNLKAFPEGSLLPETYSFTYGETKQAILKRMQTQRSNVLATLWDQRALESEHIDTPEKAVTLASMIEKEAVEDNERSIIAGVFLNRLAAGMPLQSDPTVVYPLTEGLSRLGRTITRADLQVDSPYNTYKNTGLPPTPICNPGRAALEAVLHPAETDAIFFVADGKGGHNFSKGLAEHNKYVQKFRELRIEQEKQKKLEEAKAKKAEEDAKKAKEAKEKLHDAEIQGPPLPLSMQQPSVTPPVAPAASPPASMR